MNRDGIAGTWQTPTVPPVHLSQEDAANMALWSPERRAQIIDFEVFSRLGFSASTGNKSMTVWHLEVAPSGGPAAPTAQYHPLVRLSRPTEVIFLKQLDFVAQYADLRRDRMTEILAQMEGPTAFLSSIAFLRPDRTRWTLELLGTVFRLAQFVEMRFKHALACRRPIEYSPQVQPMILTPGHGSLPSGHSTEAFAIALTLIRLLQASPNNVYKREIFAVQLMRQAARIAINRQIAGVHFPVDSAAGAMLGLTLGEYLFQRFTQKSGFAAWSFTGEVYPDNRDFDWSEWFNLTGAVQRSPGAYGTALTPTNNLGAPSALLDWLWRKALAEWT